jgi:5-methyltetrahydrofolate--homocysteine methyltransferase
MQQTDTKQLSAILRRRIMVLDGAMGTMIQSYRFGEADFRGARFADHPQDLAGNNDLLCLTQPEAIAEIHRGYLAAGADIVTTNTFNGTVISQREYGTAELVAEINHAAAALARAAADAYTARDPRRPRFVAGSLPPTNRTASLSPDVEDPGLRNVTFDELVVAYGEQAAVLLDGGVDLLLIETIFDTLNAKAALFALTELFARRGRSVPVWISGTITDASGRTLSGQTVEAFWISVRHARPFCVGLNCALGAEQLRPHLMELARRAETFVSVHPNAGLPNELGGYDQSPEQMAGIVRGFAADGLINVVGGCCGTTPEHVAAIDAAVAGLTPRSVPPSPAGVTQLSGLEPLKIGPESLFVNVGERTNVAGSRKFARLIRDGQFEAALAVARQQVRGGAQIIDVNMDDALLDAETSMATFLNVVASDPAIARVPIMIDSSRWSVIEAGLKRIQGKGIVNSISLKEGEAEFRRQAELIQRYGAAVVVMAFDEEGQADSYERKVAICSRAYRILTEEVGLPPEDIVFDPNIFAVATGIPEHDGYAVAYIEACRTIKQTLPGALVSGGVSNLSFSFRGNDVVREAMHAAFLYHAIGAGMDLGIVNAGQLAVYDEIEPELRQAVEDVILARDAEATDRLLAVAQRTKGKKRHEGEDLAWREAPVAERLAHALIHGIGDHAADDTLEALAELQEPLAVIEGPLMAGMAEVGDRFGAGKMFLPQVIRSARVMKQAVAVLEPHLLARRSAAGDGKRIKVLLATVKGDVHDIGKNIVGVVLGCNNYDVVDLGVMVPAERILAEARAQAVDVIGLSGLITPSLDEMVQVAELLQREGCELPLLIGGATTSQVHTAVKIDPHYEHGVIHVTDASRAAPVVAAVADPELRSQTVATVRAKCAELRDKRGERRQARALLTLEEARAQRWNVGWQDHAPPVPRALGLHVLRDYPLGELREVIDWTPFFHTWRLKGRYPEILTAPQVGEEAQRLFADAAAMLDHIASEGLLVAHGVVGLFAAEAVGDDIALFADGDRREPVAVSRHLRQQRARGADGACRCLADLVAPRGSGKADHVGAFVVTAGGGCAELAARFERDGDAYNAILVKALADRLAEAFAERLHARVRREFWGYAPDESLDNAALIREEYDGIRPAPGYPACPDHSEKRLLFRLLDAEENAGVRLTENCAMDPAAAVCGWYFSHPASRYFGLGKIGRDQVADYAGRKEMTVAEVERWLAPNLGYEPQRSV